MADWRRQSPFQLLFPLNTPPLPRCGCASSTKFFPPFVLTPSPLIAADKLNSLPKYDANLLIRSEKPLDPSTKGHSFCNTCYSFLSKTPCTNTLVPPLPNTILNAHKTPNQSESFEKPIWEILKTVVPQQQLPAFDPASCKSMRSGMEVFLR